MFARLLLVKPFIIRGPHDQTVLEGSSVTFPCRVGGDPMPDVLWLRTASGGNMPLGKLCHSSIQLSIVLLLFRLSAPDILQSICYNPKRK